MWRFPNFLGIQFGAVLANQGLWCQWGIVCEPMPGNLIAESKPKGVEVSFVISWYFLQLRPCLRRFVTSLASVPLSFVAVHRSVPRGHQKTHWLTLTLDIDRYCLNVEGGEGLQYFNSPDVLDSHVVNLFYCRVFLTLGLWLLDLLSRTLAASVMAKGPADWECNFSLQIDQDPSLILLPLLRLRLHATSILTG